MTAERAHDSLLLAAQPKVFLRFEFGHPQQMAEQLELMASRQPDQIRHGFRNEGGGLVRATLPARLIVARTPPLGRGYPFGRSLSCSKRFQCRVLTEDTLSESATLGRYFATC